jgi:hypothetical protein
MLVRENTGAGCSITGCSVTHQATNILVKVMHMQTLQVYCTAAENHQFEGLRLQHSELTRSRLLYANHG